MKKLSIFLVVLLLGVGMLAPNIWATSYDPTGRAGNLPVPPPSATIDNHGQMGDALYGELYRAISPNTDPFFNQLLTLAFIENTSSRWVAAHVRLRTGRYSIEVIDFPILLSPRDVFWFQFETTGTSGNQVVRIFSLDKKTIEYSGLNTINPPGAKNVSYDAATGTLIIELRPTLLELFDWGTPEYASQNELTMGYIEVFGLFSLQFPTGRTIPAGQNFFNVMGQLYADNIGAPIPYGSRINGQCTGGLGGNCFASYHENGGSVADEVRIAAQDVGKFLTGQVFLADFQTAVYAAYTMKAVKDFRAGVGRTDGATAGYATYCPAIGPCFYPLAHRDLFIKSAFTRDGATDVLVNPATIIYNYMSDIAYLNPDWATTFGPTWNDGDNWYGNPLDNVGTFPLDPFDVRTVANSSFSLDEVEDAMYKQLITSSYFNSGFTGGPLALATYTMGVFAAPTKYLRFYDEEFPVGQGAADSYRRGLNPEKFFPNVGARTGIWNLEEYPGRDISPSLNLFLPYEVSLLPIGSGSYENLAGFGLLSATGESLTVPEGLMQPFLVNITDFNAGFFQMLDFSFDDWDSRYADDEAYWGPVEAASPFDPTGRLFDFTTAPIDTLLAQQYLLSISSSGFPKVPISALMIDFELGTGIEPRNRMYFPAWDNNAQRFPGSIPFGAVGYGG